MTGKRMFAHDYTRVGFYMITILTAGRRRLFGTCADNRTHLSEAGELVRRRWLEIPRHRPQIETNTLVVMPDHIHGIVYVRQPLPKPVGQTIRGFKSGATSALRAQLADPALEVWEPGYHDRVIMHMDQDYGSLILIRPEGFPPLYKPGGRYFDLCAQGRLLVLSPFLHTGRHQPLTRERCLHMNRLVAGMCGG